MATKVINASNEGKRKLALVIGIGEYENLESLCNPENDASDMSSTLIEIGFIVTKQLHLKYVEMKAALKAFENSITSGDIILFFFAGHGLQWQVSVHIQNTKLV